MTPRIVLGVILLALLSVAAQAQAPLTINGIADKAIYTNTSFSVPTTLGYTYEVLLDGKKVPTEITNVVTMMDYHEVSVTRTNATSLQTTNRTIRLVTQSANRGDPERGLIEWQVLPPVPSTSNEFFGGFLHIIAPQNYPQGLPIPVVGWVTNADGNERRANGFVTAAGFESTPLFIRRGAGSAFLPPATAPGVLNYDARLHGLSDPKQINIDDATAWTAISGIYTTNADWPANSRIYLTGSVTIPAGITLTVGAGTIVKLNPLVNITNTGSLIINGTPDAPVIFTATNVVQPENNTGAWGGFVMRGVSSLLEANSAIFAGGGGALTWSFDSSGGGSSHKTQQPVLFVHSNSVARLTNSAVLNSAGQMGNGLNSDLTLDHTLWQRAITGGEYVGGTIIINHSAVMEFPNDDGVVNGTIVDADYDGIYFTLGTHILMNSLFGFAKDDAIDSGSGGAGTVLVTNCWVESALHEAHAWSGAGRVAESYDCVLMNCGQGLECGWSTGTSSPLCYAGRMLSLANSIGARFGDNYPTIGSGLNGLLLATNSIYIYNYRDIWGMTWRTDANGWYYRSNQMDLHSNWVSQPNLYHPSNQVWNPSADGWRLAHWMTTPPDAPVGIGLAVRTNQFAMSNIFDGVPVRLSSFTTNSVSVGYEFIGAGGTLATGAVTLAAGETVKRIYPSGFNLQGQSAVTLALRSPANGELTGITDVTFSGSVATPQISCAIAAPQRDLPRIAEGVPVRLSTPAAHAITAAFKFEAASGVVATGVVTFAAGETLAWAAAAGFDPNQFDLLRFTLTSGSGAPLASPGTVYYLRNEIPEQAPAVSCIATGAVWKYLDTGTNLGTAWRAPAFVDDYWPSGPGQLGFGDNNDETTFLLRTNTVTHSTNTITFYFRRAFTFTNALSEFTNLTLTVLRDDGAVVYLNGSEVYRSTNMPLTAISYTTLALSTGENSIDTTNIAITNLVIGTNIIAAEVHQQAASSSDLSFDLSLTANPKPLPTETQHIRLSSFDGNLTLGWSDSTFLMEESGTVTGVWSQVSSPSPLILSLTNQQRYFRLKR